jgi:hypothetical protein
MGGEERDGGAGVGQPSLATMPGCDGLPRQLSELLLHCTKILLERGGQRV